MTSAKKKLKFCDGETCSKSSFPNKRVLWADVKYRIHILRDLQPYVCTVEDCNEPTMQFDSRRSYILHEITQHELTPGDFLASTYRKPEESAARACLFCGEVFRIDDHGKHVSRHMEEIAFAVVRKPYEDWDFYSDSSGPLDGGIEAHLFKRSCSRDFARSLRTTPSHNN